MKWVLIDLSYLAHRARHALDQLEYEDIPTGILFGFFEQLRTICRDQNVTSNKVLIFADSKKSFRKLLFPSYKQKRVENRTPEERLRIEAMHDQITLLRTIILPEVGIPVYRQTGLESDDLMAQAALELTAKGEEAVIITGDHDLLQCISPSVHWYDPQRFKYYTVKKLLKEKHLTPSQWWLFKVLSGCKSDEVPGIPGVGKTRAEQYLLGTLNPKTKAYASIGSEEGKKIIERNTELIRLPHHKTKSFQLVPPKYNYEAFLKYCKRYGLLSYLQGNKKEEWKKFFTTGISFHTRRVGNA